MRTMIRFKAAVLGVALATGLAACDNPVEGEDEHHPIGLAVYSNAQGSGNALASYRVSGGATGQVLVSRSAPTTLYVFAIDEDGDRIAIDGDEVSLRVTSQPPVAGVSLQGDNRLVVTGTGLGTGNIGLELLHEGHAEFAATLPVVVGS